MEPQNTSSSRQSSVLNATFTNTITNFPAQFTNELNVNATTTSSVSTNASSPFFMSTLQQLSGLSNTNFFQSNSQTNNQFSTTNFTNWNAESVWLDQAKITAMLPMYLQSTPSSTNCHEHYTQSQNSTAVVEENLKNQVTAAFNFPDSGNSFEKQYNKNNSNDKKIFVSNDQNYYNSTNEPILYNCNQTSDKNIVHLQKFHYLTSQSQYNSTVQSPVSNVKSHLRILSNSPINNGTQLLYGMHQSSYPSSSSSHPPSNEEMVDSPLSTYSNINVQSHPHDPLVSIDLCSNSPYNYQNSFLQQHFSTFNATNNSTTTKKNFSIDTLKQQPSGFGVYCNQQLSEEDNSLLYKDLPQQKSSINKCDKNDLIESFESFTKKNCNNETVDHKNSNVINNSQVNSNVEDFSALDLRDFEEFLNNKEELSEALALDTANLFCANNGLSNINDTTNDLPLSKSSNSNLIISKNVTENKKSSNSLSGNSNSNTLVTSIKLREKIHERRAEELANADKELDRLVSLVARQNDAKVQNNLEDIKSSNILPSMHHFDFLNGLKSTNKPENDISVNLLNPVQFTPPDSPTSTDSSFPLIQKINVARNFAVATNLASSLLASLKKPAQTFLKKDLYENEIMKQTKNCLNDYHLASASTTATENTIDLNKQNSNNSKKAECFLEQKQDQNQTLVFIPKTNKFFSSNNSKLKDTGLKNLKYNRVPIYKQQSHNSMLLSKNLNLSVFTKNTSQTNSSPKSLSKSTVKTVKTETKTDAYSFTDDEDNDEKSVFLKNLPSLTANVSISNNVRHKNSTNLLKSPIDTQSLFDTSVDLFKNRKSVLNISTRNNTHIVENASESHSDDIFLTKSLTILNHLRKKRIEKNSFIQVEIAEETDVSEINMTNIYSNHACTANNNVRKVKPMYFCRIKDEKDDVEKDALNQTKDYKMLPKLVIKSIKPEPEHYDVLYDDNVEFNKGLKTKSKSKKKRKKKEKEYEWNEEYEHDDDEEHRSKKHKKHKKHKKEKKKLYKTLNLNDEETMSLYCKTKNIIYQSTFLKENVIDLEKINSNTVEENSKCDADCSNSCKSNYNSNQKSNCEITAKKFIKEMRYKMIQNLQNEHVLFVLNCFGTASCNLTKGTFLVAKEDVFKNECPLWKIDNQNLLQKYLPIVKSDKPPIIRYKNSSTYSGWCDKIVDNFLVLNVKFIKQSRAENIVEPLIPVADLFPATSKLLNDIEDDVVLIHDKVVVKEIDVKDFNNKSEWQKNFRLLVKTLLKDAINFNAFQSIKFNDLNCSLNLNEIQQQIADLKVELLKYAKWSNSFQKALNYFVFALVNEEDFSCDLCQACKINKSTATIQFFQSDNYNELKFNNVINCENEFFAALPATEFIVCKTCKQLANLYHKLYHIKCHIFKICDLKLENVNLNAKFNSVNELIEHCLNDKTWFQSIINEYAVIWNECAELLSENFNN